VRPNATTMRARKGTPSATTACFRRLTIDAYLGAFDDVEATLCKLGREQPNLFLIV
jgi:hypothetical protein